jgi:hypothetical protein
MGTGRGGADPAVAQAEPLPDAVRRELEYVLGGAQARVRVYCGDRAQLIAERAFVGARVTAIGHAAPLVLADWPGTDPEVRLEPDAREPAASRYPPSSHSVRG